MLVNASPLFSTMKESLDRTTHGVIIVVLRAHAGYQ
jgi:hypothetical protein